MSIRAFISVPLDDCIIDDLGRVRDIIGEAGKSTSVHRGYKPVKPDNYHITLKFLGDIEEAEIPGVKSSMEKAVRDMKPFNVTIHGFSGLPRIERPRVVYVQVYDEFQKLTDIYNILNTTLSHIKKERRKYIPHITFIRIKNQKAWPELAAQLRGFLDRRFGVEHVSCIDLMASELKPAGPQYYRLERVEF